jgi:DNA repair protein RadD
MTIQEILGKELIALIQQLDEKSKRTANLKNLIFQIYQERSFLDNKNLRIILINLLKFNEVKLIADTLGFIGSNETNEYIYLKKCIQGNMKGYINLLIKRRKKFHNLHFL